MSCDAVVLLGDTVSFGRPDEYALVRSIVAPIRSIITPMLGNHEVQEGTRAGFRAAWHVEPFTADLIENLPVMRFDTAIAAQPDEEAFGEVGQDQLALCDAVMSSRPNLPAIIFAHHPLANTVRRSEEKNFQIANSGDVRRTLGRHGRRIVVFSGHTHMQSVHREGRLSAVGCPPLGYWPHAFIVAEISRNAVRFETHQMVSAPTDSPDPDAHSAEYRRLGEGGPEDRAGTIAL